MAHNPSYADYQIGAWSYGNPTIKTWDDSTTLQIGKFCSISAGTTILLGGEHRTDWVTTYPFNVLFNEAHNFKGHPHTKGDVIIGNDVWVGRDVLILSGVTIGDGAVIAARSVVAKDVAPYSIVSGNPARHIKDRFPPDIVEQLRQIAWWNWPLDQIKEAWPLLLSPNIEAFINKYGNNFDQPTEMMKLYAS